MQQSAGLEIALRAVRKRVEQILALAARDGQSCTDLLLQHL